MAEDATDWRERAQSLLQAAKDVHAVGHPSPGSPGSSRHRTLFEQYAKMLRSHKAESENWIERLTDAEERTTGDREQAIANVRERRPVGAVAHPKVTGVVRKFWLMCVSLNSEVAKSDQVAPEEFILLWLMYRGHEDLAEFLTAYPFWPLGLDEQNRWV